MWRKLLFGFMMRNARSATEFFTIPPDRVVELGMQVELCSAPCLPWLARAVVVTGGQAAAHPFESPARLPCDTMAASLDDERPYPYLRYR